MADPTPAELTAHLAALEAEMATTAQALDVAEHVPTGEPRARDGRRPASMPTESLGSHMSHHRKDASAPPGAPESSRLQPDDWGPLVRYVRILLEWDECRRTMGAPEATTEGVNGDDTNGRPHPSRAVRTRLEQGPGT